MDEKTDGMYLGHIRDACLKIASYIKGFEEKSFKEDSKTLDAVIRQIGIVGEASRKLSQGTKDKLDVNWREVVGMRDKLIHDYVGVDEEVVWHSATVDIPRLLEEIKKIL